jgi:hypothetical protein
MLDAYDEFEPGEIRTGRQIAAARMLLGWRQVDLAKAAGLHRRAIQYWEMADSIPVENRMPEGVRHIAWGLARHGVIPVNRPGDGMVRVAGKLARMIEADATREMGKRMRELASFREARMQRRPAADDGPRAQSQVTP